MTSAVSIARYHLGTFSIYVIIILNMLLLAILSNHGSISSLENTSIYF